MEMEKSAMAQRPSTSAAAIASRVKFADSEPTSPDDQVVEFPSPLRSSMSTDSSMTTAPQAPTTPDTTRVRQASPTALRKSNLIMQPPVFSFVEEGKSVRAGRKNHVNYWTVITVSGKEYVVEKQFKRPDTPPLLDDFRPRHSSAEGRSRKELKPLRPLAGKARCDLCLLFYSKGSVNGVISFKRILDLRRKWGLELRGRRSNTASYIYSEARLCLFCSQFFQVSESDTIDSSKQKPPVMSTEHIEFRTPRRRHHHGGGDNNDRNNPGDAFSPSPGDRGARQQPREGSSTSSSTSHLDLAFNKKVIMSSIADGCSWSVAVSGTWQVHDNEAVCARTFVEFEPWFEVDLEALHHISTIKILNRSKPKGQPVMYRLTPLWVMLSKAPILASDIIDARLASLYSVKVMKDEQVITVEVPKDISARYVRLQSPGIKALQFAAVQVLRAETTITHPFAGKTPKHWPGQDPSSPTRPPYLIPPPPAADMIAPPQQDDHPLRRTRPQTTGPALGGGRNSSISVQFKQGQDVLIPSPLTIGLGVTRARTAGIQPPDKPRLISSVMAQAGVENLLTQTIKRYREKEDWEGRLKQARSCFTEAELQPLTDVFQQVASDKGYLRNTPLEVIKLPSSSIMATLVTLRGRNLALKEFLGDSSSLETLGNLLENISHTCRPGRKKGLSLPTDYCQYLSIMDCLRHGRVSLEEVERIFAAYIRKVMREADTSEKRAQERAARAAAARKEARASEGPEGTGLVDRERHRKWMSMEKMLEHKKIFFKRFLEKTGHEVPDMGHQWFDWAREHDKRREHQEKLRMSAPPPDITPRLPHKICTVCLHHFPGDALCESVTIKSLANLFAKLNLPPDKYTTRLEFGMNKFYRIPICVFCNQFFDPDVDDGLAGKRLGPAPVGYVPFFDDRYPDRYSMADPETRRKNTASAMMKQATSLLPSSHRTAQRA